MSSEPYGALAQNSQISQDENLFREFSNAMRAVTLLGLLLALLCLQGMEAQVKTSNGNLYLLKKGTSISSKWKPLSPQQPLNICAIAGLGRGSPYPSSKPWSKLHHNRETKHNVGNSEEHHLQPTLPGAHTENALIFFSRQTKVQIH